MIDLVRNIYYTYYVVFEIRQGETFNTLCRTERVSPLFLLMRLSQAASVFLKRRIRPRYVRIEVNSRNSPVPYASRQRHFRWLTSATAVPWNNEEGEGASGNREGKRNEDESERMGEENGYFLETGGKERKEWL